MEVAYSTLLARTVASKHPAGLTKFAQDGRDHPRIVTYAVLPFMNEINHPA